MKSHRTLYVFVVTVALAGCGGISDPADETSVTEPAGGSATTEADAGDGGGSGETSDPSARLAEVCEVGIGAARDTSGIELPPVDDTAICQTFDADTAATVQITVQARPNFEGNECDAIASGEVPEAYGDTGAIISTAAGPAFSGEQSDIAQLIGCDAGYRYLAQASGFDDSSVIALAVYESILDA
jgi:hypothetical protein